MFNKKINSNPFKKNAGKPIQRSLGRRAPSKDGKPMPKSHKGNSTQK